MKKMLGGIVVSVLLALPSAALAQVQIITPVTCVSGCAAPVTPSLSSNTPAPLVVTSSTGNVAFADSTSTYPAAMLLNDGANELYFALGNSGVTAAATNQPLPAGRSICVAITVGVTNVAAISPSGSTLKVTQATGCPPASGGGGGSGGGGANAAAGTTASAVPGSADYQGVNIGGLNVGQTGRAVGSAKAADVALNDASGNQIGTASNPVRTDPINTTPQAATVANGADVALGNNTDGASCASGTSLLACERQLHADLLQTGTVQGGAANGVAAAGNPVQAGCVAESAEAPVLAGQQASVVCDLARKVIVLPYANPENMISCVITSAMTGTTSTQLCPAPGAGLRNYITTLVCGNEHATQGTSVLMQDGSGGTSVGIIPAAPAFGGAAPALPTPLRQPTLNTGLYVQNVTTGASTKCWAVGYKGA